MNDNGSKPEEKSTHYNMSFDDENERKVMTLTIPLQAVVMDQSINGMVFMLGFFEMAKNEAAAIVKMKKRDLAANKVIVPGQGGGVRLSVH